MIDIDFGIYRSCKVTRETSIGMYFPNIIHWLKFFIFDTIKRPSPHSNSFRKPGIRS